MSTMLVLKMGSTLPSLKARRGDFEDWIIAGLGDGEATVIDVAAGQPLPGVTGHAGVVITGSHTMVTERKDWSERAAAWLRGAVSRGVPVLGICYGHQLLAHALGGTVGDNPHGRELGAVEVNADPGAAADALLGCLPRRFKAIVGHTQSVLDLPPGAVRLASNSWDGNQAFRAGNRAWGVQFHPEFDADIIRAYIREYRGALAKEGRDPDALLAAVEDTPHGETILRRFTRLCAEA